MWPASTDDLGPRHAWRKRESKALADRALSGQNRRAIRSSTIPVAGMNMAGHARHRNHLGVVVCKSVALRSVGCPGSESNQASPCSVRSPREASLRPETGWPNRLELQLVDLCAACSNGSRLTMPAERTPGNDATRSTT